MAKDEKSRSKPPVGDNSTVIDFDALGDVDEFVTPQDLVGDDLAAELQKVLDEAKSQLDVDLVTPVAKIATPAPAPPPIAPVVSETPAEADVDLDAEFESPDDVIGQLSPTLAMSLSSPSAPDSSPAAEQLEDDPAAFERQLQELLNLSASGGTGASPSPQPAAPVDATIAQAQAVTDEIRQMSATINAASASPVASAQADLNDSPTFSEEDIARLTAELLDPGSAPPVSADIKTTAKPDEKTSQVTNQTLGQLDEFLAGHADHAVADAFDTVSDVIAEQQAIAYLTDEKPASVLPDAAAGDDDFSSPEQVLAPQVSSASVPPPSANHAGATNPASVVTPRAVAIPTTASSHEESSSTPQAAKAKRSLGQMIRLSAVVCVKTTRTVCAALNRPLKNASESTRKTIGYVGLLTVTNASLLILGKLILSLLG